MRPNSEAALEAVAACFARAYEVFTPPEGMTVTEWANEHRVLSPEASAEAGQWRTSRTPYLKEPMNAFTDPRVRNIVMVAASQVGKTELELNCLAYIIDQDPGTVLYVHPTLDDASKFSRLRIDPMLRDCPRLSGKVEKVKGVKAAKTVLQKSFPGGMLMLIGSNTPSALASTPARYVIGDERDRWSMSAGREGDPWQLAMARQTTFYNAKSVQVSTPTIKGRSKIEMAYNEGTQERWCTECPGCGKYHEITFSDLRFEPVSERVEHRKVWSIEGEVEYLCPDCGCLFSEDEMRRMPSKWVAGNPAALAERRTRSFWLNAFMSPWVTWRDIVLAFLDAKDDPLRLQVVYNTKFGQLWEDRSGTVHDDELMERAEDYGEFGGRPVEVPEGALCLTCGVDVQDTRLEYEVVGHGRFGETWGIEKGVIHGRPDTEEVWKRLDGVVGKGYLTYDGKERHVMMTCVDSGGHFTQEVYEQARLRQPKRVFAIKGRGGEGVPFVSVPTQVAIRDKRVKCWLYTIGVDAGKAAIMASVRVQEPGPRYMHFPRGKGYDEGYFTGLLSEQLVLSSGSSGVTKWRWEKIPGHERNEALDCRNYAMAAASILSPDFDALEHGDSGATAAEKPRKKRKNRRSRKIDGTDEW